MPEEIQVFPHQMAIFFHISIWHLMLKNTFTIIEETASGNTVAPRALGYLAALFLDFSYTLPSMRIWSE